MPKMLVAIVGMMLMGIGCQKAPQWAKLPAPFLVNEEAASVPPILAEPVLKENGIFFGDKGFDLNQSGKTMLMAGGRQLADMHFSLKSPWFSWMTACDASFTNKTWNYNQAQKRFTYQAAFPLDKEARTLGTYRQEVALLPDGLIQYDIECALPRGYASAIQDSILFLDIPFAACESGSFMVDGKAFRFASNADPLVGDGRIRPFQGQAKSFVFMPGKPETQFTMTFQRPGKLWVDEERKPTTLAGPRVRIRIYPEQSGDSNRLTRKISFKLDLRTVSPASLVASPDCHMGIDFWKSDRLHVPNYALCRNLAQNPSFEAGLRYYQFHDTWGVYTNRSKPAFSVDENVSKFGNCSLRINAVKGGALIGSLSTFAIPVVEGKKYTVSFYAKSNRKDGLRLDLRSVTAVWLTFPPCPSIYISGDWKRYDFTITAPNRALTILMTAVYFGNDPSGEGAVWIDGLQIEEGEAASDYAEKPLNAILLTSSPDNFLGVADKEINARLKITAPANTEGSVQCEINDFFYQKIWAQKFSFKTDDRGVAAVALPLENLLGTGVYVLRADFELKDGYRDTDYFRISRMNFLNNTHRNKDICGTGMGYRSSRCEDILKRYREIGYGSARASDLNKEYNDLTAGYGIRICYEYLYPEINQQLKAGGAEGLEKLDKMTPELENKIENIAYEVAKAHPWVNRWALYTELEGRIDLVLKGNYKDFAKLQIACYKGVKRFDPNKMYWLGGACNMMPQNGTRYVDSYLKAANEVDGKIRFDGASIHPYRTTPENPDLDDDAAVFLGVLDKHGYTNAPVYWDEGIFYTSYTIPEWGLDPHRGCSTVPYNAGCPSYHMGWGERISAAYCARSWLVALKYQARVRQFIDNTSWTYMDAYLTPFALQKVPNTLGRFLGNASFKQDIRFAPDVRCYVFEDENKRPVAAMWSHNPQVDRGYEISPTARFNFKDKPVEFFDLMENTHAVSIDAQGFADIPITPFPIFIRGASGELAGMCQSIQDGMIHDADKAVIQLSAKPLNSSELELSLNNLVTREFKGKAEIKMQDKVLAKEINIGPRGSENMPIPMPGKIPSDRIAAMMIPVTITEKGFKPFETDLSFNAFAVRKLKGKIFLAGNPDEWKDIPSIPIKNRNIVKFESLGGTGNKPISEKVGYPGDFEAGYQMAWDDECLYLRVAITDDVFFHDPNKRDAGARYDNDSLQIYIDTMCDARGKVTKGFDGNDYNYDFYPNPDGSITAFRRFAPEMQAAGGLFAPMPNMVEPGIKGAFTKTDKGYVYEVAMPKRLIAPLQLKTGSVSGFAIYLNDHDGKCVKSGLSTTPPGTGGYMNPHLYPVMVLVE